MARAHAMTLSFAIEQGIACQLLIALHAATLFAATGSIHLLYWPYCLTLTPHSCFMSQGVLRVGRFNPYEGRVTSASVGQDIFISGRLEMNRAFDGACVCAPCCSSEPM